MIKSLNELAEYVKSSGVKTRIAVACAEDQNTLGAIARAVQDGFVHGILLGSRQKILSVCSSESIDASIFEIIDVSDASKATVEAVRMVKENEADVLMKGLVGTDKFLKAVLDKQKGLLPPKAVMSYVCALQIPQYRKLLFVSDTAVLPFPDLEQKQAMIKYAVKMAHRFGITSPKVALISATEKVSNAFPATIDYALLSKMGDRGQFPKCTIDGPLDIFLACDPESIAIKNVPTPIDGDADVLIFPNIEAANSFYKGL
ncbi:MAG: phosphate acyltransferase, partial [Candidatus Cloacimonadaceae bacterium]|nr:phosphate acyltransferase [Candidatus Cloacimonadaceae bacterium]